MCAVQWKPLPDAFPYFSGMDSVCSHRNMLHPAEAISLEGVRPLYLPYSPFTRDATRIMCIDPPTST